MLERFVGMQEGLFVMYDSTATQARIMKSGDSILLYTTSFGDPAKDGVWLFQKMYMSSFPEEPLSVNFLKITQSTKDSIIVEQFDPDDMAKYIEADNKPSLLNQVEFDLLKPIRCNSNFKKTTQVTFFGTTPICEIDFGGGAIQVFANQLHVSAKGVSVKTLYYAKDEAGEYQFRSQGNGYLVRTKKK